MITKQKKKKIIIILIIMSVISLTCLFYNFLNPFIINILANNFNMVNSNGNLLVHFINVDQADAVAINLPDDKVVLIDAGSEDYNVTYTNYLKENVLNHKTNKQIDYLILTHADMDHIGGTLKLLKNFKVNTIFMPKIESDSAGYQEILSYIQENCNYKMALDDYEMKNNGYSITFLKQLDDSDTNNSSQVVKLEYKNKSFLFTGDISAEVELEYITEYGDFLDCDVLKVAHHGSKMSTSEEFLQTVTPKYSVISVGADNSYGHPTEEVLNRLDAADSKILRTDKDGNVLFVVGDNYNLSCLTGTYYITGMSFDYRILVLVIDAILIVNVIVIIVKKEKVNKHKTKKTLEY